MKPLALLAPLAAIACAGGTPVDEVADPTIERIDLGAGHRGLSGLARTDRGVLWAVSERGQTLLRFDADGGDQVHIPVRGVGDVDLESLAWLGGQRFAAGTEGRQAGRAGDEILMIEVRGDAAVIVDRLAIEYRRLQLEARANQGIEGLCVAGDRMLAAIETPIVSGGGRLAPLVLIDLGDRSWRPLSLRLTSQSGKISGLACRSAVGRLEALAIERHFEVARVLHFEVKDTGPIQPAIAADLTGVRRWSDNPEGVVWIDDRSAFLILDNHYGSTIGATELQRISIGLD